MLIAILVFVVLIFLALCSIYSAANDIRILAKEGKLGTTVNNFPTSK